MVCSNGVRDGRMDMNSHVAIPQSGREGTIMSLANTQAWRWLLGAVAALVLLAAIPNYANAQIISICVNQKGKIVGIDTLCEQQDLRVNLTWNIPGPQGPVGDTGPTGIYGPTGEPGPQGPQGSPGAPGAKGPDGAKGLTGPTGPQGPTGDDGPKGLTGLKGATGPMGLRGDPGLDGLDGINGDHISVLAGGTYPQEIYPAKSSCMGPGNGVSLTESTIAVPLPAGILFNIQFFTDVPPNAFESYTFNVCIDHSCDSIPADGCTMGSGVNHCTIGGAFFLAEGDTLSVCVHNGSATTTPKFSFSGNYVSPPVI
jgi:Collagen triple helix repeat (20 copies)